MTPRERLTATFEGRQPTGRVPHFELVFFLTMEAFGRVHPCHRNYRQWDQMQTSEKKLHIRDIAEIYVETARRFEHSAIMTHGEIPNEDDERRLLDEIRQISNDEFFLMMHGDSTYAIPAGSEMTEFCCRLNDNPQGAKDDARRKMEQFLERGERFRQHGVLNGFALCSDYCLNTGPFFSLDWFDDFVTPYLADLIRGYRQQGFYVIKHTDGNIMPILDRLILGKPHALHSLDPQGEVDIAEVKRLIGDRVTLVGNVNCGKLDTGTEEECVNSARYALTHGMPGGRYVFSTSNCIYTGMRLSRYELILDIWRREGNYSST